MVDGTLVRNKGFRCAHCGALFETMKQLVGHWDECDFSLWSDELRLFEVDESTTDEGGEDVL